ncbi:hypothetical protein CDAR_190771 [Caerostris darwini]|uniref:Uncharacterized protein n=1 Tax=Caerostris darwini TaxID=1538125 RepID=A0AAV4VB32_9ARAC|nr:hypothetical protein CDAR_190771 [Caerostris darwini]
MEHIADFFRQTILPSLSGNWSIFDENEDLDSNQTSIADELESFSSQVNNLEYASNFTNISINKMILADDEVWKEDMKLALDFLLLLLLILIMLAMGCEITLRSVSKLTWMGYSGISRNLDKNDN